MKFTYTEQPVPTGWWTVADLPIGLKVTFDLRQVNNVGRPLVLANDCGVLWRNEGVNYKVRYSTGHVCKWRTGSGGDPYVRIHITGIVPQ